MKKMKFYDVIGLIIYVIFTSLVTFLCANMIYSDISNYANGFAKLDLATLPHLMLCINLISFGFFFIRYLKLDEKYRFNHKKAYFIQFIVYSFIGLISSIITGTYVYGDYLAPYPYNGAIIVITLLHLLILSFSVFALIKNLKNKPESSEKNKSSICHILLTIPLSIFAFIAFFRLGTFIAMPFYVDYNHFWYTFPFYLAIIIPFLILMMFSKESLGIKFKNDFLASIIIYGVLFLIGIGLTLYTWINSYYDTLLISLISPAMPLERLMSFPIEAILIFGLNFIIPLGKIIYLLIKRFKKN